MQDYLSRDFYGFGRQALTPEEVRALPVRAATVVRSFIVRPTQYSPGTGEGNWPPLKHRDDSRVARPM